MRLTGHSPLCKEKLLFWLVPTFTAQTPIAKHTKIWLPAIYDRVLQGSVWTKEHVKILNA